jgi:hypothetical protein
MLQRDERVNAGWPGRASVQDGQPDTVGRMNHVPEGETE